MTDLLTRHDLNHIREMIDRTPEVDGLLGVALRVTVSQAYDSLDWRDKAREFERKYEELKRKYEPLRRKYAELEKECAERVEARESRASRELRGTTAGGWIPRPGDKVCIGDTRVRGTVVRSELEDFQVLVALGTAAGGGCGSAIFDVKDLRHVR